MSVHSPPHPGEFIPDVYLEPFDVSPHRMSESLGYRARCSIA